MKQILKVLVGSRAHGLHTPESDYDYRGVYVEDTSKILSIGHKYKGTHWVEGEDSDNTAYEIGHFLQLAIKSNPSILEVFVGPVVEATDEGIALRSMFPHIWNTTDMVNAFIGYSTNQRQKLLSHEEQYARRKWKYAVAYLRTLLNGNTLIRKGTFSLEVPHEWKQYLRDVGQGKYSAGSVLDQAEMWKNELTASYEQLKKHDMLQETYYEAVNNFLLKIRKDNWETDQSS